MKRYILDVAPNGEVLLPPSLLKFLKGEKHILIRKVREHYELLQKDGSPIVMPEASKATTA